MITIIRDLYHIYSRFPYSRWRGIKEYLINLFKGGIDYAESDLINAILCLYLNDLDTEEEWKYFSNLPYDEKLPFLEEYSGLKMRRRL